MKAAVRLSTYSCFPVTSLYGRLGILFIYCTVVTLSHQQICPQTHTQGEHMTSYSRVDRNDWKCDTVIYKLLQM